MGIVKKIGKAITKPFKKAVGGIGKIFRKAFGDELGSALMTAAIAAASIYTGGAAAGALGVTGASGAAALGSTAGMAGVGAAGLSGYQAASATNAQIAAQQNAQNAAQRAANEAEIIRKRAMLAEQMSLSSRANTARNVRNVLQGLSTSSLGGSSQALGG